MERAQDTRLKRNKSLLCTLKRVCQLLSVPGQPRKDSQCREFWLDHPYLNMCTDFEGVAAYFACAEYVFHYVVNMNSHASPTYLGYIYFCGAIGLFSPYYTYGPTSLSMLTWLASHGADLFAKIRCGDKMSMPVTECLLGIMPATPEQDYDAGMQTLEFIHQLLPILIESEEECLVGLYQDPESVMYYPLQGSLLHPEIIAYMSVPFLLFITMRTIEKNLGYKVQWR